MKHELDYVLPARRFRDRQLAHFVICHGIPVTAIVCVPLLANDFRCDILALLLWLGMWTITGGIGVSVGYHRHFAHRSFRAHPALRHVMAFCGAMSGQGPVIYWVALHRRHHALSDLPGDPHSPNESATGIPRRLRSFMQGHMLWAIRHDVPTRWRYSRDLMADPVALLNTRYYPFAVLTGIAIPSALGAAMYGGVTGLIMGLYWGGLVRLVAGHHLIWSINSFCHATGSRYYLTHDASRNVAWLAPFTFGECWHNNHHAFPTSARLGLRASQIDGGWYFIQMCRALGLVHGVRDASSR
jgi:stearoyl-CoA desaturase (Delta-9 desaturase)